MKQKKYDEIDLTGPRFWQTVDAILQKGEILEISRGPNNTMKVYLKPRPTILGLYKIEEIACPYYSGAEGRK